RHPLELSPLAVPSLYRSGGNRHLHLGPANTDAHQSGGPGGGRDERRRGPLGAPTTLSRRSARPTQCPPRTIHLSIYLPLNLGIRSEEHTSELQSRENLVC